MEMGSIYTVQYHYIVLKGNRFISIFEFQSRGGEILKNYTLVEVEIMYSQKCTQVKLEY